jgi:hypothetical protein
MARQNQHYVPRFLLKNFTHGKKQQIFVYDKSNDKCFKTNIKNVAAENAFYDINVPNGFLTLEPSLAHLEADASGVIKKLMAERSIRALKKEEVAILAMFLAVQFVRTREHRLRFEHLKNLFIQKLREIGAKEENILGFKQGPSGFTENKFIGIKSVFNAKEFMPYFLNKAWVLFETSRKCPFYISGNPLTLHNELDHGIYGNLGLAVRGIEIYLPISTTLSLGLLCPTISEEFHKAHEQIKILDQMAPGLVDSAMNRPIAARAFCEGLVNGTPVKISEENVKLLNSLQIVYSSRFVYCETDSFELVGKMLSDNEKYREGLKMTIG